MEESQELTSEQDQNGEPTAKEETPQQEAAPAPSPEAQRIAELEAQLAQAKREAAENWNKYLRERADMENFRKRQERMAVDRVQREKRELFQKILGVMDNVERALKYQDTMDSRVAAGVAYADVADE